MPAGGYVRVRFVANNPGYWFLHCHLEPHQVEGMSILINELEIRQNSPPDELTQSQKCGNFKWSVASFNTKVNQAGLMSVSNVCIVAMVLLQLIL